MPKVYRNTDRQIVAAVGEQFVVEFEGNASTGYEWQLEFDERKVKLLGDEYRPAGRGVGVGGRQRFTLRAVAAGEASILARYKRAWEQTHLEQKEISLLIEK